MKFARNQGVKTKMKIIHAFSNQLDGVVFTSELPLENGNQKYNQIQHDRTGHVTIYSIYINEILATRC